MFLLPLAIILAAGGGVALYLGLSSTLREIAFAPIPPAGASLPTIPPTPAPEIAISDPDVLTPMPFYEVDPPPLMHDTGMLAMPWRDGAVIAFHDEMSADEVARIVASGIRRESGSDVPLYWDEGDA